MRRLLSDLALVLGAALLGAALLAASPAAARQNGPPLDAAGFTDWPCDQPAPRTWIRIDQLHGPMQALIAAHEEAHAAHARLLGCAAWNRLAATSPATVEAVAFCATAHEALRRGRVGDLEGAYRFAASWMARDRRLHLTPELADTLIRTACRNPPAARSAAGTP